MAYIAQRTARLSGRDYSPGETVPDEVVGSDEYTLVRLGFIALAPGARDADAGSEQTKAELELARAELTLARAQLAVARSELANATTAKATARPVKAAARKDTGGNAEGE